MKMRPFEISLLATFGVLAIVALVLLNTASPGGGSTPGDENYVGPVQIWGTLPAAPINTVLEQLAEQNEVYEQVSYRFVQPESFNQRLIEALADQAGPDLLLISHEEIVNQRKRIVPTPYTSLPLGTFRDTYVDGAQIFALSDAIYGRPLMVDPLMLYWNRDILTTNGFLSAPRTWEELLNVQFPAMIDRTTNRTIERAVLALGVYQNAENAFGTISTLLIQAGSRLVSERTAGERVEYSVSLSDAVTGVGDPLVNSLSFYQSFSQPANSLYSWNASFVSDRSEFISEDLIFYFGFASEAPTIARQNPNLNFDLSEVPQGETASVRRTYGAFYGLAPLRTSRNLAGAFNVINQLSGSQVMSQLAGGYNMVPASRSLVAGGSNDQYLRIAYQSAPITFGWLNPELQTTNAILADMVEDVSANRSTPSEAARTAEAKITNSYD